MILKKYYPVWNLWVAVPFLYVVHKWVFLAMRINFQKFYYSLETLYLFFLIIATIILLFSLKVKERNVDHVGMVFLALTSLKLGGCYLVARPILKSKFDENSIEKNNFFVIFIIFLVIETGLTIKMLNSNHKNSR